MRRNLALRVILAAELGVAALGLFFQLRLRADLARAIAEFDPAVTASTVVALAPWFLPATLGAAAALSAAAIVAPLRRSRRVILAGAGLMIASGAVIFAITTALLQLFQPA